MSFTTLISATDLARHIRDKNFVIVDCRYDITDPDAGRTAFLEGHIQGAQFAHLDADLSNKSPGPNGEFRGHHPLPEPDAFMATLRRWGINQDSQVVVYDAQGGMFAARLWWMLRWVGHEAVAVLDGGFQAWHAQGQSLSTDTTAAVQGNIALRPSLAATVDVNDVFANLSSKQRTVVDARPPNRFHGQDQTLGGHIPGAKNRFFKDNLLVDGRFKSPEQLRTEFAAVITTPQASIMQCGSGAAACHNLLAMEVAGLSGAVLYPGSWSEWCANPARPVTVAD